MDPSLLWYLVYLVLTVLSLEVDKLFVSAMLLDWVMIDATTRHATAMISCSLLYVYMLMCIMVDFGPFKYTCSHCTYANTSRKYADINSQ